MASTRQIEIFQDLGPLPNMEETPQHISSNVTLSDTAHDNLPNAHPWKDGIVLNPPASRTSGRSPLKSIQQANNVLHFQSKNLYDNDMNISLPPPSASAFITDSPVKKPTIAMSHPVMPPTSMQPIFTTFDSHAFNDKENTRPSYHNDNLADFPDPLSGRKSPLKRAFDNACPQQERNSKKVRLENVELPDPENMPLVPDNGRKPPYSYASLIGMSILRSPGRRLTLAHIYKWISDTFSYYRLEEAGWQNSIRHNLSLNKSFVKRERPKDDPGKGNYWAIEPGMEQHFLKDKTTRRPNSSAGPSMKTSSSLSSDSAVWSSKLPPAPASKPVQRSTTRKPEPLEPSSEATIPASDAPSQDDETEDISEMPPPSSRLPLSSPPQAIHSSPPIASRDLLRDDTPSPVGEVSLPSNSLRSSKRKMVSMDDSGYFSSLDSSASRSFANPKLPDLNSDRPRIKRGRAEEEIARIRSSSHDSSPIKFRSCLKQTTPSLVSSSPLHHFDSSLMLPPLTPALKLKPPPNPPASISPNTNLRIHRDKIRELVGSPIKHPSLYHDDVSFSPAFNIVDEDQNVFDEDYPGFNIFTDNHENLYGRSASASPLKRSVHRSRTDRANKTSNILADVTGTSLNRRGMHSNLKHVSFNSPLQQKSRKSPLSVVDLEDDEGKEDLFGLEFFEDEEPEDFGGLDILQGFQKIGGSHNLPPPTEKSARPPLGARSQTSAF